MTEKEIDELVERYNQDDSGYIDGLDEILDALEEGETLQLTVIHDSL